MDSFHSNKVSASCQVDIPNIPTIEALQSSSPLSDYIPQIIKRLKKLKPETERSKLFSQRRAMASVGKKTSREQIFRSLKKAKNPVLNSSSMNKAHNDFVDFIDTQTFIKNTRNRQEILKESQFFLPKLNESKAASGVKKGKLGPLVHSPFRELQIEEPDKKIRKYSYFHIRNFSVRDASPEY